MKKKTLINEVRQLQKIAGILREFIEADPESVAEAFQKVGIDMSKPVIVIEISGHFVEKPRKVNPIQLVGELQNIKDTAEESEGVWFDYEAADSNPAEEYGLKDVVAKLSVVVSDAYEFVIFQ